MFYIVSMELIPKSTHHPTNKKARVRRLFDPKAFHTENYKKSPYNVWTLLIYYPTPSVLRLVVGN